MLRFLKEEPNICLEAKDAKKHFEVNANTIYALPNSTPQKKHRKSTGLLNNCFETKF